jgi:hypothetical protein
MLDTLKITPARCIRIITTSTCRPGIIGPALGEGPLREGGRHRRHHPKLHRGRRSCYTPNDRWPQRTRNRRLACGHEGQLKSVQSVSVDPLEHVFGPGDLCSQAATHSNSPTRITKPSKVTREISQPVSRSRIALCLKTCGITFFAGWLIEFLCDAHVGRSHTQSRPSRPICQTKTREVGPNDLE